MARYFNNKPVELLAPAGNFEIFKGIITLGCDAVYFGGKNLNMRLHRKDYNFSDEELSQAVRMAHDLGKKAYITVNNLYNNEELGQLKEFLLLLNEIKPDALIVQDMSVLAMIKELGLDLPLHASVMMNVHNLESIKAVQEMGVSRVVLSREAPLSYSKYLAAVTNMELEYFIHGDMCVAHGGQCLYSGILFQQSSNRGRCLKPCRWRYHTLHDGVEYQTEYPMAVKDMCMYEHIPELIDGGITSFKIEGRMRNLEYLVMLLEAYGDAIDRYIQDPLCYDRKKQSGLLYENRKRDTSTAYAFGTPGLENINTRYEGTGTLFSSGKVFSTATQERSITSQKLEEINRKLAEHKKNSIAYKDNEDNNPCDKENKGKARLSAKVGSMQQAKLCLDLGVDAIYLSGDIFLPNMPFSIEQIKELGEKKGETKLLLGMPHMMFDMQFEQYKQLLSHDLPLDGLLATSIGGIRAFSGYQMTGDYPLNILNCEAAKLYQEKGLERFTISPEASLSEVISLINQIGASAELIVHGSPAVMYMEHDLYANVKGKDYSATNAEEKHKNSSATDSLLYLVDEAGFHHPVYKDYYGRNHMLLYKNLCYLPLLKGLYEAGLTQFRIEGAHLSEQELARVVNIYQHALSDLNSCEALYDTFEPMQPGWTLGSFAL